jgi:hypothetical protein
METREPIGQNASSQNDTGTPDAHQFQSRPTQHRNTLESASRKMSKEVCFECCGYLLAWFGWRLDWKRCVTNLAKGWVVNNPKILI